MEKEKQLQENINERTEEFEIIRQAVLRKTQAEDTKRQMHSLVLNAFKQFSSIKLVNIPLEITNIFVLGLGFLLLHLQALELWLVLQEKM